MPDLRPRREPLRRWRPNRGRPALQRQHRRLHRTRSSWWTALAAMLVYGRGMAFDQDGRLYVGDYEPTPSIATTPRAISSAICSSVPSTRRFPNRREWPSTPRDDLLITCQDSNAVVQYDRGVDVTPLRGQLDARERELRDGGRHCPGRNQLLCPVRHGHLRPGQTSQMILLATQEDPQATGNVSFSVQLSNPTGGATIATRHRGGQHYR